MGGIMGAAVRAAAAGAASASTAPARAPPSVNPSSSEGGGGMVGYDADMGTPLMPSIGSFTVEAGSCFSTGVAIWRLGDQPAGQIVPVNGEGCWSVKMPGNLVGRSVVSELIARVTFIFQSHT